VASRRILFLLPALALALLALPCRKCLGEHHQSGEGLALPEAPNGPMPPAPGNPDVAATLVVYNANDPDSADLAHLYAEKRAIPKEQVLALKCATTEEITREEYDQHIAAPLRKALTANLWWKVRPQRDNPLGVTESNRIRFVVLIRGIPLKIAPTANYPGDKAAGPPAISSHNEACVDSELAVLGTGSHPISGLMNNPYYRSFTRIGDAHQPELMLVCRLDGSTPAVVRRMILDSVAVEKEGLNGFAYVDARGISDKGYIEGDQWLFALANDARRHGIPVILDQGPGLFPEAYPMRRTAFYFGWYTEHVSGPFARPDFGFEPGAVAVHIHSYSAATLRDPLHNWCGPLLAAGADATVGSVYEPYLEYTPHLDILFDRLMAGFTFAESAYMAQRSLSWMTTFVGDPLYRPFPMFPDASRDAGEWGAYRKGAVQWFSNRPAGEATLRESGRRLRSGLIFEGNPEDIIRVAIHEVGALEGLGRGGEAVALARKEIGEYPKARAGEVLQMLEPLAAPARVH
jgi:uncharacterized protein (TIGR03790 family)